MPLPAQISPSRDDDGSRAATHVRSSYRRKSGRRSAFESPLAVSSIFVDVCSAVSPIRIRHRRKESGRIQEIRKRRCKRIRYPVYVFPKINVKNIFSSFKTIYILKDIYLSII